MNSCVSASFWAFPGLVNGKAQDLHDRRFFRFSVDFVERGATYRKYDKINVSKMWKECEGKYGE